MVICAIECFEACPQQTWLQVHESFVVTTTATIAAVFGMLLQCILRSRCTSIRFGCLSCDRDVLNSEAVLEGRA